MTGYFAMVRGPGGMRRPTLRERTAWLLGLGLLAALPATAFADVADSSVTGASHFEEKLVPAGPTSTAENAALLKSLSVYQAQSEKDDFSTFDAFLRAYPHSAWRVALLADMGLLDYHYGYFSRALDAWQSAWEAGRDSHDPQVKALVDRVAGELLRMHARLGHADTIDALLADIGDRKLTGQATEALTGARQGLWMMRNDPGVSYLCGPMALKNLLISLGRKQADLHFLDEYRSGPHGVSLAEVATLAGEAKLDFRLVHRDTGQPIPIPSIVHWKVSHFAAIVGQENGRYHVKDPTFGQDLWVARGALDTESSGYYLAVGRPQSMPWRVVASSEAAAIRGMGYTNSNDPRPTTPKAPKCPCGGGKGSNASGSSGPGEITYAVGARGMTDYTFNEMLSSLTLEDTPVGYSPARGPEIPVTITYNQREASQPANFTFFNVSPKWTLNWLAYIQDDPTNPGNNVARIISGGGMISEGGYSGIAFTPEEQTGAVLSILPGPTTTYQLAFPDGSINTYGESNGATTYPRLIFLTSITDRFGIKVTLKYDSQFRLTSIVDGSGRSTTFGYSNTLYPLQVTTITDPFKRSATLTYDSQGRLSSVKDAFGLVSSYAYDSNSLVDALTTPYGTTNFVYGQNGNSLYLQATDPLGYIERTEYIEGAPNIPFSDPSNTVPVGIISPFNEYLNDRDSYYWDKHAYAVAAGDYTQARQRHWAHLASNTDVTGDTIESIKFPLENRIWFNYPGQQGTSLGTAITGTLDSPIAIGRVLDDGTTQLTQNQFNSIGNITSTTDPVGRQTTMTYASNNIDLVSVVQKTGAGTTATIAQYGGYINHQPQTYTDAAGQVWKMAYNSAGQLTQATDPLGYTVKYTYDTVGDLLSIINENGKAAVSYTYDSFGRIATRTDSEGWKVSYAYDTLNRLTEETYPDGTTRKYVWTKLDLTSVTDRQGRITKFAYDADRNLTSVTDPDNNVTKLGYWENGMLKTLTDGNGNVTSWNIDIESRPTGKTYADGTTLTETYQNTISRLASITDALGQVKQFTYTADDRLAGVAYQNAVNPTPGVTYTYDPYFPRTASMTDGYGTTSYSYVAPGQLGALSLAKETGPAPNANVSYQWDALGRVVYRAVGGNPETFSYDALGRPTAHDDDIGEFVMSYLGQTGEVTGLQSPVVGSQWTYDTNTNDRRLLSIANGPNARSFTYTTTPESDVTGIKELLGTASQTWTNGFDKADRLTSATLSTGDTFSYTYDKASNITGIKTKTASATLAYNAVNQVKAYAGKSFTYDANGNLTQDDQRIYKWDAENRLVQIGFLAQPGITETFRYDGLNHLVVSDLTNGSTVTETHYFWCGETLCEERNGRDKVIKRYFVEGEEAPAAGTLLYYGTDQIGSVRDVLSAQTGGLIASADYDPFGNLIKSSGQPTNDFRFGQMVYDPTAKLFRANFRQYDSRLGRWLSRNPSLEAGGANLYSYAAGNPLSYTDPLGADANPIDYVGPPSLDVGVGIGQSSIIPHNPDIKRPGEIDKSGSDKVGKDITKDGDDKGDKDDKKGKKKPAPHKGGPKKDHPPKPKKPKKPKEPKPHKPKGPKGKCKPSGSGSYTVSVGSGLDANDQISNLVNSDASAPVTVYVDDPNDDDDDDDDDTD